MDTQATGSGGCLRIKSNFLKFKIEQAAKVDNVMAET